jgi:O-antigen ligase
LNTVRKVSRRPLDWPVPALIAVTMFLAPALGSPREELLQDTLKSAVVSFGVLLSALVFFALRWRETKPVRLHAALLLPVVLIVYALGSMAWSHTYLAGVEAIRWFVFALLMFLALNTFTIERMPLVAWGIVAGSVAACGWAALQFLFDFSPFPQGPHPASTFVNRNFFAEYAICTLPFIAVLLARARKSAAIALMSVAAGLVIVALCMTGTRAALVSLWLLLLVVFPLAAWRFRTSFEFPRWPLAIKTMSLVIMSAIVFGAGLVPTPDAELAAEGRGVTALERAFTRTASIAPGDSSLSIRMIMWRATGRMIAANPVWGVGAGAWENEIPLYQDDGSQIETDFYVHNEFLQLVAEYGVIGWLFLVGLLGWLAHAAWRTWKLNDANEAAWRGVLLASVAVLLIVSNVGFAWRMAATDAIFALALGGLAASDTRIGASRWWRTFEWRPAYSIASMAAAVVAIGLAASITFLAADSERKLVRASRLAITISTFGDPNSPRWDKAKAEMLELLREGVAINPHYRKLTPVAADELARWGDWNDAIWVWESVLSSRPYVVAILTNVTRGYIAMGHFDKAAEYLERAQRVQPNAKSVRSAEVLLYASSGQDAKALDKGRIAISQGIYDFDMTNAIFVVGRRQHDYAIAEQAMRLRVENFERNRVQAWVLLGYLYETDMHRTDSAIDAYTHALTLATPDERTQVWDEMPAALRPKIDPALAPPQTSASKG